MATSQQQSEVLVLVTGTNGLVVIPRPSVLTRLHYFDGKLLRADDLTKEQDYLRSLVYLSNKAGGFGVVHGFDVALSSSGDAITVGPGMAIDPNGRVLLLPVTGTSLGIDDLIKASRQTVQSSSSSSSGSSTDKLARSAASFVDCIANTAATDPTNDRTPKDTTLYLITVGYADALCGQEDVLGKICEEACATSTDRPFAVEGVVFRAIPLLLNSALATSTEVTLGTVHQRSLVASAYFADEKAALPDLISGAGLRSSTWCKSALMFCGNDVPIAVVSRSGSVTQFLDPWIARRERIEESPRRYWAFRMAMRPWNVFLAQILQFQCQLTDLLAGTPGTSAPADPCTDAFKQASDLLANLKLALGDAVDGPGAVALKQLEQYLAQAPKDVSAVPTDQMLIDGGIVELPSAGYLPVSPSSIVSVNAQVRRMMGEGVDLRFCVVRPDYVPHALEEAQHMERISLIYGLDHPEDKPQVDILVPDGQIIASAGDENLFLFRTTIVPNVNLITDNSNSSGGPVANDSVGAVLVNSVNRQPLTQPIQFEGASRAELLQGRGAAYYMAGLAQVTVGSSQAATDIANGIFGSGDNAKQIDPASVMQGSAWLTMRAEANPFEATVGDIIPVSATGMMAITLDGQKADGKVDSSGKLQILTFNHPTSTEWAITAKLDTVASFEGQGPNDAEPNTGSGALSVKLDTTLNGALDAGTLIIKIIIPGQKDKTPVIPVLEVKWGGSPRKVFVRLYANDPQTNDTVEVFHAGLVLDNGILDPNTTWHSLAIQAIEAIAVAFDDSLFAATAEASLFPVPGANGELIIRAVKDWVLFHRRRVKRCSREVITSAAPPVKYALFTFDDSVFNDPPGADDIFQVFQNNDTDLLGQLRDITGPPIAIVEFAGGKTSLNTKEAIVSAAWQSNVPAGLDVAMGLIGTKGSDDTATLEIARVGRIELIVNSYTPKAPDVKNYSIADVPTAFDVPDTDGFLLYYARKPPVALECQSAYAFELPQYNWNDSGWDNLLVDGNGVPNPNFLLPLGSANAPFPSAYLGAVNFGTGSTTIAGGDDFKKNYSGWTSGLAVNIGGANFSYTVDLAFYNAFSIKTQVGTTDTGRADNIAHSLDPSANLVGTELTIKDIPQSPMPQPCPVATVMAVRPRFANVVELDTNDDYQVLESGYFQNTSNTTLPAGSVNYPESQDFVRFKDLGPLSPDFGPVMGGLPYTNYTYVVIYSDSADDLSTVAQNVWNELLSRGYVGNFPDAWRVRHDPAFAALKKPGARYLICIIRTHDLT